ncbi:maleylpyruvate isomerase family mycothiol-dependent enzyme [Streptomyces sodiiphilus]
MTRPAADLTALQDATDRFLVTAGTLDDAAVERPSRLPGWTRGHVLAHLARNADALVNVLAGRPMYASAEARDADIERGAGRPVADHLADVRESAARLAGAAAALTEEQWDATVELRNGVTDLASAIPFRRWVEVELHHVDLDAGHTLDDLPGAFTDGAVPYLARRFAGHPELPPLRLTAEDGRTWSSGGSEGEPVHVSGSPQALTGWLSGRTGGGGLTASGPLPALPAL